MFEKLALMEQKYEEISARLSDAETVSDNKLFTQLMRDYKYMTPIIEKLREYRKAESSYNEAVELRLFNFSDYGGSHDGTYVSGKKTRGKE